MSAEVQRIIDTLPEKDVHAVKRFAEYLRDAAVQRPDSASESPAPYDVTTNELDESERAWEDYLTGRDPGKPLSEVQKELRGESE